MKKWNMIIDVAECTNCNLCTLAVMDEYVDNEWPDYSAPMPKHGQKWINILQKERGQTPMIDIAYVPTMCNHCDDAPCIKAAPKGVIRKRRDGIVIIDPEKAKGQKQLVDACPYGHRSAIVSDRRDARAEGYGRRDGPHCAGGKS